MCDRISFIGSGETERTQRVSHIRIPAGAAGGLLPVWGYHVRPDLGTAGNYFLALGLGMAGSMVLARKFATQRTNLLLTAGCFVASAALLMLTIAAPPAQIWYQTLSCFVAGVAAGMINAAIFQSIGMAWEADPAGVTLRAAIYFGGGSMAAAVLMAQCFGGETIGDTSATRLLAASALIPAAAAAAFRRLPMKAQAEGAASEAASEANEAANRHRWTVLAILFGLLLFFQFANVWSIGGWLPVYLIDRLGMSPTGALTVLAVFWMALTAGRVGAAALVKRMPHGRLLGISAFCALFGGVALTAADTRGGAVVGIVLMGAGFSAIYPLAAGSRLQRGLRGIIRDISAGCSRLRCLAEFLRRSCWGTWRDGSDCG